MQPELDFFTSRGLAVKAQPSDADPGATPAANAFQILNGKSGTEFDKVERKLDRPFFTGDRFLPTNKRAFIEGEIELVGPEDPGEAADAGTAACEVVLLPCGMARAIGYFDIGKATRLRPISRNIPKVYAMWWHSGTLKQVDQSRGNLNGLKMEIGQRFMSNLRLQGSYENVEEQALPEDFDYSGFDIPVVSEHNNSYMLVTVWNRDGQLLGQRRVHLWGKMLSVDMNNTLSTRQYTEKKVNGITDRKATFTARFARPSASDFDVYAARDNSFTVEFVYVTIEDRGESEIYCAVLTARGQIDQITEADIDGDFGYEVTGVCIASDAGGDEFGIDFAEMSGQVLGVPSAQETDGTGLVPFDGAESPDAPDAAENDEYYYRYLYIGGWLDEFQPPVTWSVQTGALPTGVTLNASTGEISGTATTAGTYNFTIRATLTGMGADPIDEAQTVTITA